MAAAVQPHLSMAKEPQSYGSGSDWVKGNVGETVNKQKSEPTAKHEDFYDSRRGSETTDDHTGGKVSDEQLAENAQPQMAATEEEQPLGRVTDQKSGAKRGGFFKNRDYS